jgi:hypothetical protein
MDKSEYQQEFYPNLFSKLLFQPTYIRKKIRLWHHAVCVCVCVSPSLKHLNHMTDPYETSYQRQATGGHPNVTGLLPNVPLNINAVKNELTNEWETECRHLM